jgi:hypothetical protein
VATTSAGREEFIDGEVHVGGNLAQQSGRDVATGVQGHGRRAAVGMPELLVGAALADLCETEGLEQGDDLPRLENRQATKGRQATWCARR